MKRRIFKLLLFLLLGAIINVAVAWGLARWFYGSSEVGGPVRRIAEGFSSQQSPCWYFFIAERGGTLWITGVPRPDPDVARRIENPYPKDTSHYLPTWSALREQPLTAEVNYRLQEEARGWPMLALRSQRRYWSDQRAPAIVKGGLDLGGVPIGRGPPHYMALPLRPLWPGFAINTIFYATIVWLLFAVPGRLRRWRRIKRGLCPACGYPIGFSDVCTECGVPLR